MSPSGAEVIRQIRSQIEEVDPSDVKATLSNGNGIVLLDVRESDEWDAGHIPGAKHIPRGYLESRVEGVVGSDRSQRVVIYCASGQRSALAANTLKELLGYEDVASMNGGITLWKDRGYDVEVPVVADARSSASATRATCSCRRSGSRARRSCSTRRCCCSAPAGSARRPRCTSRRPASARSGIVDDDDVDLSNLQRQVIHTTDRIGTPKVDSAEIAINGHQPGREGRQVPGAPRRLQHHGDHRGLRRDRRRRRQLPDALPAQRRDGAARHPGRVSASILGFDGQLSVFAPHDGPCYRCLYPVPPPAELAPSCGANGVLGVLPGTMGLLQATEVVKLVVGAGEPLIGRLLLYEALGATFTELKVRRDPECPICSIDPSEITDDEMGVFPDYEAFCAAAG